MTDRLMPGLHTQQVNSSMPTAQDSMMRALQPGSQTIQQGIGGLEEELGTFDRWEKAGLPSKLLTRLDSNPFATIDK